MRYAVKYVIPFMRAVLTALLGLLLPFAAAQAHRVKDDCTRSDSGNHLNKDVTIPITRNIGRDVQYGEAFGPWFPYSITWTCVRTAHDEDADPLPNDNFEVKTQITLDGMTDRGLLFEDSSFRVYGDDKYNVGFIARVTQEVEGGSSDTTHIKHLPLDKFLSDSSARQHGDVSRFHLKLEVRLVKLSGNKVPQDRKLDRFTTRFWSISRHPGSAPDWDRHSKYDTDVRATIHDISAACTTPDVHVLLGDAHSGNLVNVNDAGPIKDFNLRFEHCPAYMSSVAYRFQSVPLQAISNGTLPLDLSLSTASGVGVQVLHADATPLAFSNTFIPLTDYNAANPSAVYLVPMKARIIRTDGALQSGSVHAAMKMVVRYR